MVQKSEVVKVVPTVVRVVGTLGGHGVRVTFANGFGASVIDDGYGSVEGLYELAVLGQDERITYDTPITDDVVGYLSPEGVYEVLRQISALPTSSDDAHPRAVTSN